MVWHNYTHSFSILSFSCTRKVSFLKHQSYFFDFFLNSGFRIEPRRSLLASRGRQPDLRRTRPRPSCGTRVEPGDRHPDLSGNPISFNIRREGSSGTAEDRQLLQRRNSQFERKLEVIRSSWHMCLRIGLSWNMFGQLWIASGTLELTGLCQIS